MAVFVKVEYAVVCRSVRKEQFARVVGGSLRLSHLGLSGRFLAYAGCRGSVRNPVLPHHFFVCELASGRYADKALGGGRQRFSQPPRGADHVRQFLRGGVELYIWAISTGQILETSLGYYTNPLMNVLFGFLFLRERPSRLQGIAILLACIGVLLSFLGHNQFPWLALSLAFTFALYGFIRKTVSVEALPGLFIETIVLIPFSLGWILWLYWNGEGFLCSPTVREGFLLFLAGPVTSLPLVMFAYAARHMRLMTLGLLQYISPTCTFFLGIFMFGETLNPTALVTFIFIWLALLLYTVESWRQTRHLPH